MVVALGGNALFRRDEQLEAVNRARALRAAARLLARVSPDYELTVLRHYN
jgi:carbamate kinase